MSNATTMSSMGLDIPKVIPAEVRRFEESARIKDPVAFAAILDALIQEKVVSVGGAAANPVPPMERLADQARALRADTHWHPSATDIQRGRVALLRAFERPGNLPLPEFAKLAHKSRQQIYKDLAAHPRRLLALNVGRRGQRLPDWQLDPLRLRLTREVLKGAADVDAWTLFQVLSGPLECLGGRSPVEVVSPGNLDGVVEAVYGALGLHQGNRMKEA